MMVYKYSLHDPDSGKVLYEGTAADLAAQGVVRAEKILPTLWRDQQRQHKRHGKHRWDITREKVEVAWQPESLQGAAAAEKDGERPGKAAEATGKAENDCPAGAETGATDTAEKVPGKAGPAAAGRAGAGGLQRQGPGAWEEGAELRVLGSGGETDGAGMVRPVCTPDCRPAPGLQ